MNIIILDDYQDAVRKLECAALLEAHPAKVFTNTVKGIGQLSVRLRDAEVLVLIQDRTTFNKQLLEKLPKLKLISQMGNVGPHLDVDACTQLGIAVTQTDENPEPSAELTWALIMAAMRRIPQYVGSLKHGAWQQSGLRSAAMPDNFGLGIGLRGKTLGIWGYGRVGKIVASYGRAFGMKVLVWGSERARSEARTDGLDVAEVREMLFTDSDVLSLHLQLSESTRSLVTANDLALMKPTSLLVNISRAELIEEGALVGGLNRGRPGMAAVDVFESEPILQGHPLLRLENAICTPHINYVEKQNYEMMFGEAFQNILQFIKGQPTQLVNPEVMTRLRV